MAYDSVRAQLDKLLGPDRNGPLTAASTTPTDYHHPDICKNYLLGFCPDDLHIKHRSEPGSCRRRHSDAAKVAFEKDVASSKAGREKARWTASLLSECRTIVMDEDRKIRCHARRLKETYDAQGDLAGLMIQSFDTLKKLGMVSKDAKIRVLSEIDEEDFIPGPVLSESVEQEESSRQATTLPDESNNPTSSVASEGQRESPEGGRQDKRPMDESKGGSNPVLNSTVDTGNDSDQMKQDSADDDTDDAEDDDDFGLIKVIPAGNSASREPGKSESTPPTSSAHATIRARNTTHSSDAKAPDEPEVKDKSNKSSAGIVTEEAEKSLERNSAVSTEKASEAQPVKQKDSVASTDSCEEPERCTDGVKRKQPAVNLEVTLTNGIERSQPNDCSKRSQSDSVANTENRSHEIQAAPSMDEFYERGIGPDGLLMLDRKQSLRVCACCGGYISLVDAESRLLSHYGGKSHHSLAQLRKKVVELEEQVALEPVNTSGISRMRDRDAFDEREHGWSCRNNERRHSRERYGKGSERYPDRHGSRNAARIDDRRRGRPRRDSRGFGTAEWYNSYVHEGIDGHSLRRGDERLSFDGGQPPGYVNGRKRYRSRSPRRDFRRSRRHY